MKKQSDEALSAYVSEVENTENNNTTQQAPLFNEGVKGPKSGSAITGVHSPASTQGPSAEPIRQFTPTTAKIEPVQQKQMSETAKQAVEQRLHGRTDLPTEETTGIHYKNNLGYLKIPIDSLPTQGMFYPEGTEITIRAARGAEIKHWSTMNDQDLAQISQTDDILNYIVERCVSVRLPGIPGGNWKDLKDVDRLYLLLAVREFTFLDGENELMVPVSEGRDIPVTKEMIDFIHIPDDIMKHYSPEQKCFVFRLKNGKVINMYIPSLGVSQWLKNYAQQKAAARQGFDTDFILYAPMLINDFRRLSQRAYEQMVAESAGWSAKEWSIVSYVRDSLAAASEPVIKYQDENGAEVTIPLTFRGGIKNLFIIHDPLSDVD